MLLLFTHSDISSGVACSSEAATYPPYPVFTCRAECPATLALFSITTMPHLSLPCLTDLFDKSSPHPSIHLSHLASALSGCLVSCALLYSHSILRQRSKKDRVLAQQLSATHLTRPPHLNIRSDVSQRSDSREDHLPIAICLQPPQAFRA